MFALKLLILSILLQNLCDTASTTEQTYFIRASGDFTCAAQPCLTLDKFSHNTTRYYASITLQFGAGNHVLNSRFTISHIKKYSMVSKDNISTIVCGELADGFTFKNVSMITLTNLTFIGCGSDSRSKAVLQISQVINANISMCIFRNSKGRVIEAIHTNMYTIKCVFKNSSAGVLTADYNTPLLDIGSTYTRNTFSINKSVLLDIIASCANFTNSTFNENFVAKHTMIRVRDSGILIVQQCELMYNNGTRVVDSRNSTIKIFNSIVTHNFASYSIYLIQISNTNVSINNSILAHNEAKLKTVILQIRESTVVSYHTLIITNNTSYHRNYNILDIRDSKVMFEKVHYSDNMGSIFIKQSTVIFSNTSTFQNHTQKQRTSSYGGIITSIASKLSFQGRTSFYSNEVRSMGGAIYASESQVYANDDTLFVNNKAGTSGGALYLDHSKLICQKNCTFIGNTASKGGAILAINSIIAIGSDWDEQEQNTNVKSSLIFAFNSADKGGAIYLEMNSKLRAPKGEGCTYGLEFDSNKATHGEAVFVNDYTNTCKYSTCFIEAPSVSSNLWNGQIKINHSSTSENTTIYGGLLHQCKVERKFSIYYPSLIGINYMKKVTKNANIEDIITSDPVRICYCRNNKVTCDYTQQTSYVKRGRMFKVSIAALDQVNHTFDASIFITSAQDYEYRLGTGQQVQKIHKGCSDLTLQVFSPNDSVQLIVNADSPCKDTEISKTTLQCHVTFKKCTCPIGFQPLPAQDNCLCDCDQQIKPPIRICHQSSQSLLRQEDFWITYVNSTDGIHYLIYPQCPYDYCYPSTHTVNINLNIPNGVDAQCAYNRTGLLCSSCESGLSLSLGSSRCISCPRDWPKLLVIIALGAIAFGVLLVSAILFLNLTVTVGTLNGLIFYANMVASNKTTYSPLSKSSFFSVFIAWFNLELGLDTCFYNGLDTHSKVWLQFAFPAYLIAILFTVIILSTYSSKFAKLISKRNPIATLATLVLLSYVKFLRNIIEVFSVAVLKYTNGSHQIRWLPDANIAYLQGRHIPLFLIATITVVIGLAYTILLLTWQWLLKAPNYKLLRWIRNTRLNLFMEANVTAYNSKHRYWTGLLLLIRVAYYLLIAYNTSNEVNASLLAMGLMATCLLFLKAYRGKVYKKKMIDHLDTFTYFNLLILSIGQLYNQSNKTGQTIVIKISISASFFQFLFVLIYHIINTLLEIPHLTSLYSSLEQRLQKWSKLSRILRLSSQETNIRMQAMSSHNTDAPTFTEIGLSDSKEASAAEYGDSEEQGTLPFTLKWEETESLREPLLQESQVI